MSEEISVGMDSPRAEMEVGSDSVRGSASFFLDILESLCLAILDGIGLGWIWPFAWAYFVSVADLPLCTFWDLHPTRPCWSLDRI